MLLWCNKYCISLVAHKLHQIHMMNNQEKITAGSNKLKVQWANLQTISSHPVRFSTYTLFSSLVSFALFLFAIFGLVFLKIKIYNLIHSTMRVGERWKDFHPPDFRKPFYSSIFLPWKIFLRCSEETDVF